MAKVSSSPCLAPVVSKVNCKPAPSGDGLTNYFIQSYAENLIPVVLGVTATPSFTIYFTFIFCWHLLFPSYLESRIRKAHLPPPLSLLSLCC